MKKTKRKYRKRIPKVEKVPEYSYKTVTFDDDGWAWNTDFKPREYDLVYLERENSYGTKKVVGWWTGSRWMGLYVKPEDRVIKWKRKMVYEDEMD